MKLKRSRSRSFIRGMYQSAPEDAFPVDAAPLILNAWIGDDGSLRRRFPLMPTGLSGFVGSSSDGRIYGAVEFTTTAGVRQWLFWRGDAFHWSDDYFGTVTEEATSLDEGFWSTCTVRKTGTNYLIATNGGASAYSWDGTTWTAIADFPAGAKVTALFNGRVWAAGHDGVNLHGSKIDDFEVWDTTDGVILPIQTHDGDNEITGLFSLGSVLLVFKRNSVSYVDGFGQSDIIVAAGSRGIARSIGTLAWRCIVGLDQQNCIFLSERGLEHLSLQGGITLISSSIQQVIRDLAWNEINAEPGIPWGVYYEGRNSALFFLPTSVDYNSIGIVYRLARPGEQLPASFTLHSLYDSWVPGNLPTYYRFDEDDDGYTVLVEEAPSDGGRKRHGVDEEGYSVITDIGGTPMELADLDGYTVPYEMSLEALAAGFHASTPDGDRLIVVQEGFAVRSYDSEAAVTQYQQLAHEKIALRVLTRPETLGEPDRRKRVRSCRLQLAAPHTDASVYVRAVADGVEQAVHAIAVSPGAATSTHEEKLGGRGHVVQLDIVAQDDVVLRGFLLGAELLGTEL